jgi:hypothetical protein
MSQKSGSRLNEDIMDQSDTGTNRTGKTKSTLAGVRGSSNREKMKKMS